MNLDEQISYYEEKVGLGEKTCSKASPGMREHVYASEVFPYKVILRCVRLKAVSRVVESLFRGITSVLPVNR